MDPNTRQPQSFASFRPDDQTAQLLLQLLQGGQQGPQQSQPQPAQQPNGLLSLLRMLLQPRGTRPDQP